MVVVFEIIGVFSLSFSQSARRTVGVGEFLFPSLVCCAQEPVLFLIEMNGIYFSLHIYTLNVPDVYKISVEVTNV